MIGFKNKNTKRPRSSPSPSLKLQRTRRLRRASFAWKDETEKRREKKNTLKILKRVFEVFILAIMAGSIVYILFFASFTRIKEINITGANAEIKSQTGDAIRNFLSRKILWIFPSDGIVLFSRKKAQEEIEQLESIKSAAVKWNIPNSLDISIEERIGALNWCDEETCGVLDAGGFKMSEALDANFPIVNENCKSENLENNSQNNKINKIIFISKLNNLLSRIDIKTKNFYLEDCFTQKIIAKTDVFDIYFNLAGSAEKQVIVLQNILTDKNRLIEKYVDLQVEGKVYYK